MKNILFPTILFLLAACTIKPETKEVLFEKEGGKVELMMSGSSFFYYDNNSGYEYSQNYSDGMLK